MVPSAAVFARTVAVVLITLGAIGPAWALDCAHQANRVVEHSLCAQPVLRALDSQIVTLTAQLANQDRQERHDLKIDAANWQANTLHDAWQATQDKTALVQALAPRYRERIAYLRARLAPRPGTPIARTLLKALTTKAPAPHALLKKLAADRAIQLAPGRPAPSTGPGVGFANPDALFAGLGRRADQALDTDIGHTFNTHTPVRRVWLPRQRVGVLEQVQGSQGCLATEWFQADAGGKLTPFPAPPIFSSADRCATRMAVVRVNHQIVALRIDEPSINQKTVRFDTLENNGWQAPGTIVLRYDHRLGQPRIVRRKDSSDAFWRKLARPTVEAFDRHPVPGFKTPALAPSNEKALHDLRQQLVAAVPHGAAMTAPLLGGNYDGAIYPYTEFADSAVYFAQATTGHWLLGRIGHGNLGWRESSGWLVGFWSTDAHDHPVPLASVYVPRQTTRLLGAAILASAQP